MGLHRKWKYRRRISPSVPSGLSNYQERSCFETDGYDSPPWKVYFVPGRCQWSPRIWIPDPRHENDSLQINDMRRWKFHGSIEAINSRKQGTTHRRINRYAPARWIMENFTAGHNWSSVCREYRYKSVPRSPKQILWLYPCRLTPDQRRFSRIQKIERQIPSGSTRK